MIAKKIGKKADVADHYTQPALYIAAASEKGETLDRFWIANCGAGEDLADLDPALAEIEVARKLRATVKDKTDHLVVSFRPIAFNKVHPQTLKAISPYKDFQKLEATSRAMERTYGLTVDKGMSDGRGREGLSPTACDFEANTWTESFQTHVLKHKDALLDAKAPPRPTRARYRPRPLVRHPNTARLWRRYLTQKWVLPTSPSLAARVARNWKLFLMTEAYEAPLAFVRIMAHKEALAVVLGVQEPKREEGKRRPFGPVQGRSGSPTGFRPRG
ncbi:hypothetical protein [Rhodospirillum sp. A1_3_36]|uniref:hypothetical protein n=1 Tax=Rhodospirillum sp. A1_3_36 TaxID=3391666 RepID=UPI0039A6BD5C